MKEINNNTADIIAEARKKTTAQKRLKELANISFELAEIVAKNIGASPELLVNLASHDSKAVKKAVTSNPNTPKKILFSLGTYFPKELLNNPIFDFSLLGDLRFIHRIPTGVLSILVQQNNVPSFLLNYAAKHPVKIVTANIAKMHVAISGEMTKGWHEAVQEIIKNGSCVSNLMDDFNGVVWYFTYGLRHKGDFETPYRSFKLLTNFYEFIPSILLENQLFKEHTAKNAKTTTIVLKQLAYDENSLIRRDVAENPNTPAEILKSLSNDSNNAVRNGVAGNPSTPIEILKSFATSPDTEIGYRVAGNPSTPREILELFANDSNNSILRAVAENPSTPAEILKSLANDWKEQFSKYVAKNPNISSNRGKLLAIARDYYRIVYSIAKNPSTPVETLESLADNADYWMRKYIAENPNAPAHILKSFVAMKDKDNSLYCSIAKNPHTPIEILESLANNSDNQIRESVADNSNTPVTTLKLFATDKNDRIRLRVARNLNTPINLLESLANDSGNQIREAIAKNPNTPLKILEKLANDSHLVVRQSVSENPQCTLQLKKLSLKTLLNQKHHHLAV